MIVKMIQDLGIRMEAKIEKMQEMINKDLKYCKLDKMRRQRNILQAKEQDKNPQDQKKMKRK